MKHHTVSLRQLSFLLFFVDFVRGMTQTGTKWAVPSGNKWSQEHAVETASFNEIDRLLLQ